ncbi:MAG: HlyD family type I secretion periplasmic adaptor subunit [Gammaproteobacteria bacterium]|nr:HlyD family type I secretion periplasmic adaptor subunit [Gammaproteobacteria bacterium]
MIKKLPIFTWFKGRRAAVNNHYDFLPAHLALADQPPSPFARITGLTISGGIIIALIWACWGQLDVQATATGQLVVSGRSQVIQAYEQSRLIAIHVKNGQRVEQGTPLLSLNTLGVNQDIARLLSQSQYYRDELIRYQVLIAGNQLADHPNFLSLTVEQQAQITANFLSEQQEYTATLAGVQAEIAVNLSSQAARQSDINALVKLSDNIKLRLDARQALKQLNVISQVELLSQEKELLESQRLVAQQQAELAILRTKSLSLTQQLHSFSARKRREWFDKQKAAQLQIGALEQELSKFQEREQLEIIRSPVTGTVQQLTVYTLGAVLQPAQNLMIIAPDDSVTLAEIQILNKDVGFIYAGQTVTIKVDAFPYTRYGTIEATLLSVSRDSTKDERLGLVFPAQVKLQHNNIMVDGQQVELSPGMSVVAEIKTDKRRVIDYLLSPIQHYQAEALREK